MKGKQIIGKWIDQIIKYIEMREKNWEEIQEIRKWKNRNG